VTRPFLPRRRRGGYLAVVAALAAVVVIHSFGTTVSAWGASPLAAATATAAPTAADIQAVLKTVGAATGSARSATSSAAAVASADASSADASSAATTATPSPIAGIGVAYESATPKEYTGLTYGIPLDCGSLGTCTLPVDVYVPSGPGPYATVVLLRGGPGGIGGRSYVASWAAQLAADGLLVYSIDVRDLASEGGGYPQAMQDTACAIRYARATASQYDGDGSTVTLVGHSFGGYIGAIVSLNPVEYAGGCPYGGSGRPDAFVGLAGSYDVAGGGNASDFTAFFGGDATATASVRAIATPYAYASGSAIPVRLVAGTADDTVDPVASQDLYKFLLAKGWNVGLNMVPDASHMSVLSPSEGEAAVFQAATIAIESSDGLGQVSGRLGP
jgi:acetyl esterase/lipase